MKNTDIKVFNNLEFGNVRIIIIDDEPWFVAKDISDFLNYSDASAMTRYLDEDEKANCQLDRKSKGQIIINESGLYSAILRSKRPEAKKFKKWITSEVLPSIRKHGAYITDNVVEMIYNDPQAMIDLLTKLKQEKEARIEVERRNNILMHTNKTYTATEIAKELGFKSAVSLNKDLCNKGIQYKVNNTYVFYSEYAGLGYDSIKQQILDSGKEVYNRHFTQDGRKFLLELYNIHDKAN